MSDSPRRRIFGPTRPGPARLSSVRLGSGYTGPTRLISSRTTPTALVCHHIIAHSTNHPTLPHQVSPLRKHAVVKALSLQSYYVSPSRPGTRDSRAGRACPNHQLPAPSPNQPTLLQQAARFAAKELPCSFVQGVASTRVPVYRAESPVPY